MQVDTVIRLSFENYFDFLPKNMSCRTVVRVQNEFCGTDRAMLLPIKFNFALR
jgi:hypothetical protein